MEQQYKDFWKYIGMIKALDFSAIMPKNLSRCEFVTLLILEQQGKTEPDGIKISSIAEKLGVAVPAVSRTLKGLEEKRYVKRISDEIDRRNIYASLSDEGKSALSDCGEIMDEFALAVLEGFSPVEMETLNRFICKIHSNAKKKIAECKFRNKEKGV